MSLTLYVDGDRWRAHLRRSVELRPGLVPVCKGNGYGFGLGRLARKSAWLGVPTIAVGQYEEIPEVADRFDGDLLVLTPWRPFHPMPQRHADRVVHTVGRLEDLHALAAATTGPGSPGKPRLVLERRTSMLRHGFTAADLRRAADVVRRERMRLEGVAVHLPLTYTSHVPEVSRLLNDTVAAGLHDLPGGRRVWVSHLSDAELAQLRGRWPDLELRPRVGTDLWLGDREALRVRATVLDAHRVRRGETYGYRGRSAPRDGTILVVAGGTSHGIGLEAPMGLATLRSRAATVVRGGLDAAGFVRSPYLLDGRHRLFAEPPHMQASMLFLGPRARVPEVGEELDVRVRHTTTDVDRVVLD